MADFLRGVNLPWLDYGQDFGSSAWHLDGGIARPAQRDRLRRELGRLAEAGASVVRWWLLADGRSGLRESPSGRRVALDDRLLEDLDVGLDCLDEAGIRAILVVLDFLWFDAPSYVDGVETGGRSHYARDPVCREALMAGVMRPIAGRHAGRPTVAAWDLINEPEWATLGFGARRTRHAVSATQMRAFLAALADVFGTSGRPLTVGLASARWLSLVEGLDLDLHQVHWYAAVDSLETLRRPRRPRRGQPPLLLGEFASRDSPLAPDETVRIAESSGYCGALAWSLLADDHATDAAACLASLTGQPSPRRPA